MSSALAGMDAHLSELSSNKFVQGILILTRPTGMIVKSSGPLFALPVNGESEESGATVGHSESARKYAGMAYRCVKSCEEEARGLDEKEGVRLMRLRMGKYEVIMQPEESFMLVIVKLAVEEP